ncbi:hypothetical protein B0T24DRAFT_523517 [Lasiosphaeria ovina]|uniref:JmjC domain-containing protein n=1 Tax=Lasiosphaeria ovina TaxID=92902 RepID=A0AAE0NAU8_9PEZI|nr:hypothetical protein B0T24DRAFT_523517 [Lasiosphaeria ovina]
MANHATIPYPNFPNICAPLDNSTTDEIDEDLIVLSPNHLQRVAQFRNKICLYKTDTEKYELCLQIRDDLLNEHTGVQLLVAACEHVMFTQCAEYKDWKESRDTPPAEPNEADLVEWDRFLSVAKDGLEIKSKCVTALKTVARYWGQDVVQHYQWAYKGRKYCDKLCAAAREVHDWEKVVTALNSLILKRSQQGMSLKRRPVSASLNPIEQGDLDNLRKHPPENGLAIDLPDGFGFDKFGLIVHEEYTVVLPEPDSNGTADPPILPETDSANNADTTVDTFRKQDNSNGIIWSSGIDRPIRRRTASLPDITQQISKRQRLEGPSSFPYTHTTKSDIAGDRPMHDGMADDAYRRRVLAELQEKSGLAMPPQDSHGERADELVRKLLEQVEQPNTDSNRGVAEALFCTGDEAANLVESGSPHDAPIITEGQQQFRWSKNDRPVVQLFRRMGGLDKSISIQIPSRSSTAWSFEVRKLSEVRERFLNQNNAGDPWNILDLQSPLPQSILPNFLTGENCQLLLQVRNAVLMEERAERIVASAQKWNEWKNVLEWVLLSEGGHNTAPHTDSHGFATWITPQEESIGFGWMSCPTEEEREAWMANPHNYTGGRWRYVVLKPGQSIFFMPGTIHFVFRVQEHQTLALGGHVLQWSGIQRWMQVVLAQMKNPATTNEDMRWSAPKLVHVVTKLVAAKAQDGGVEEVGGEAAVAQFFASVKVKVSRSFETER